MPLRIGNTVIRFEHASGTIEIALSRREQFYDLVGHGVRMREIFAVLEKVAASDLTVLVRGETGTGKELVARAIHRASKRAQRPLVVQDCSAIPANLIESILFGHERGSFTGAADRKQGCFEVADGGTLFLDEIGELDISLQPKLLRVLETREVQRVGGTRMIPVDVRVVAATNRDLRQMVNEGTFREDLYYRLSVVQVDLPPLRERPEDVPALAHQFLEESAKRGNHGDGHPLHDYARRDDEAPGVPVAGQRPRAQEHDRARRLACRWNRARDARPPAGIAKIAADDLSRWHGRAVRRQRDPVQRRQAKGRRRVRSAVPQSRSRQARRQHQPQRARRRPHPLPPPRACETLRPAR